MVNLCEYCGRPLDDVENADIVVEGKHYCDACAPYAQDLANNRLTEADFDIDIDIDDFNI